MSNDCQPLALDDILHLNSPSQSLLDDLDIQPPTKSTSPEPLPDSDIVQMRRKVIEMRHVHKSDPSFSLRENELTEMVLRLTAVVRPDQDQLLRQAEIISALTQQRDLLLHQAEEQRLRWNSDKDGWDRMAEALIAQQAKNRIRSENDEDLDRLHAAEADNKSLRQRLNETQSRLQMLESELTQLRPLLLMQPLISRSSMPPPTPNPKTHFSRRRKKDITITEDEEHAASEEDGPIDLPDTPSQALHSQVTPRTKSRKSEAPTNPHIPHKRRFSQKAASRGLSADARAEHLLLAARKIGKHRAGVISGMVHHLEEQNRERRREESATTAVAPTPKTPKRNTSLVGYTPESGYLYMNGQTRTGPGLQPVPFFIPAYPRHLLQTPSSSTTAPSATSSALQSAQKQKQDANPPTPLDSLLSAARSMMHEDVDIEAEEDEEVDVVGDSPAKKAGTRHARSRDMLASPVPKRRKIATRTDKPTTLHELSSQATDTAPTSSANASGAGRVRSALDVLADQAAAFSTQDQSTAPSQPQPQMQTKGKEKEQDDLQSQDASSSTPRPRAKIKSRRKEPEVETNSAAPASRSSTPRTDSGDNQGGSTSTTQVPAGGFSSEAQVDPGGGTSTANASNTSSPMLDSTSVPEGNRVTIDKDVLNPRIPDMSPDPGLDDSADSTPRPSSRTQRMVGEEGLDGDSTTIVVSSLPESEPQEASPPSPLPETTPPGGSGSAPTTSTPSPAPPAKNKELARVADQDAVSAPVLPAKRQRSPYVKWSKEEDDLLAQAVAKYGQKWDLVQKALPSRGYHQVRQRWLRKLGVFDSKPDLSSFQTAAATFPSTTSAPRGDSVGAEPRGNPKLGLAPLSSERAFSVVGRPPSLPF